MMNRNSARLWRVVPIVASLMLAFCSTASAGGDLYVKQENIFWNRNGVAFNLANGVRDNAAGVAPAATTRDTSGAIDVRDHWTAMRRINVPNSNITLATALVFDTLQSFGTLHLQSTKHSLDSISIVRQWSQDGSRWNTVDSIGGHWVFPDTIFSSSGVTFDTLQTFRTTAPAILLKSGIAQKVVNYQWSCNPWFGTDAVTAQATVGVNFIRFIITMTNGDYVGAGQSDGWTGWFTYNAVGK